MVEMWTHADFYTRNALQSTHRKTSTMNWSTSWQNCTAFLACKTHNSIGHALNQSTLVAPLSRMSRQWLLYANTHRPTWCNWNQRIFLKPKHCSRMHLFVLKIRILTQSHVRCRFQSSNYQLIWSHQHFRLQWITVHPIHYQWRFYSLCPRCHCRRKWTMVAREREYGRFRLISKENKNICLHWNERSIEWRCTLHIKSNRLNFKWWLHVIKIANHSQLTIVAYIRLVEVLSYSYLYSKNITQFTANWILNKANWILNTMFFCFW